MAKLQKESLPEISESYHNARKAYGLASALLILWELVGIEIGESPISGVDFTLQSPTAIPVILIVLVFYFGFRFSIEYHHLDQRRRVTKPAAFDFYIAHGIAVIAILIYLAQRLYDFQIFESVTHNNNFLIIHDIFAGFLLGSSIVVGFNLLKNYKDDKGNSDASLKTPILSFTYILFSIIITVSAFFRVNNWRSFLTLFLVGFLVGISMILSLDFIYTDEKESEEVMSNDGGSTKQDLN